MKYDKSKSLFFFRNRDWIHSAFSYVSSLGSVVSSTSEVGVISRSSFLPKLFANFFHEVRFFRTKKTVSSQFGPG